MTPVLDVVGVTVRFGGLVAVSNASMTVQPGEIRGLIGPNGAGKSTFFNVISGVVRASEGKIIFSGQDISASPAHVRAANGIRRTFQSVQLLQDLTVLENVLIGLHPKIDLGLSHILMPWRRDPAEAAACGRVQQVLERLEIGHVLLQPVSTLSFAEQRFVEIARALATEPTVLMLDEPAAGLSPSEVARLTQLVRQLRDDHRISVIVVEHVISFVMDLCDQITVLDNGVQIAEGDPVAVAANPKVRAAYLGEEVHAAG